MKNSQTPDILYMYNYTNTRNTRCENMADVLNENYISIEDAALFLNIKPVTLRKWIKDQNVPAHKIGKQWKFKRSELEAWVKSGESAME